MPWFRVDDAFYHCPKVLRIPRKQRPAAIGLWLLAGTWCTDNLTDGHVPSYMVDELGAAPRTAQALVDAKLWEITDDGYYFHDWADYQPTRADVEVKRARTADKVRNWRSRNRGSNHGVTGLQDGESPGSNPAPVPEPVPVPKPTESGGVVDLPLGGRADTNRRQAQDLVTQHRAALKAQRAPDPMRSVVIALVDQTAAALAEGKPPELVLASLAALHQKRLGPGALPSVIHEVECGPRPRPTTNGSGGLDLQAAMQRAIEADAAAGA